ncbi:MAG: transglutaminase [Paenibacillaceae bacterium]|jgi:transglutaminase-like putative cysteine protease|nr:transglutaminase [Paenibacillaceae bacterium]
MRKFIASILAASTLFAYASAASAASWLNDSNIAAGSIGVQYQADSGARVKVMVTKDGTSYTYDLKNNGTEESFPLQLGDGTYKIAVLENTTGNKYKSVYSTTKDVVFADSNTVYLNSTQNVNWAAASDVVAKAKELTDGKSSTEEKVKAIYEYIIGNVTYDYNLAANVATGYIPNLSQVLVDGTGICYDYSSLFAAMTRSIGIPSKLMMGTSEYVSEYHAWNEVLVNGAWVTVDTTVDAGSGSADFAKDSSKYVAAKIY